MTSEFELAQSIDQTNLNPLLSYPKCVHFLEESEQYNFASVAILPIYTKLAANLLKGSQTRVCVAISYPLGGVPGLLKARETAYAIKSGAQEIDYVMNITALKAGEYDLLLDESREIISAAEGRTVKVIIEMWNLSQDEIKVACKIACDANVSFVKSSTAFKGYKAMRSGTIEDAKTLLAAVNGRVKVKIAGGINNAKLAVDLLSLGVARIGTSSGVEIIKGYRKMAI